MTVCDDCKWNFCVEVTDGLFEQYCNEGSANYMTEDGCFHFDEQEEDDQ
jgi:hypothetical protein